jgi:pimeloyl-ACP methyl ester carboxylesterase
VSTAQARTADESVAFFPAGKEWLLGIMTRPTGTPLGIGFVVLGGGATPISPNRNRLSVRLCRRLSALGYHAVRFDYHGAGDSTGSVAAVSLARPHVDDLRGAVAWLRAEGVDRVVLAGSCLGSRTALAGAPEVEGLEGVILMSLPLQDITQGDRSAVTAAREWTIRRYLRKALRVTTLKGLLDPRKREIYLRFVRARVRATADGSRSRGSATPATLVPLDALAQRGVPVLFLYGERDGYYKEFLADREAGPLKDILTTGGAAFEVRVLPGQVHGFTTLETQDAVVEELSRWLAPEALPWRSPVREPRRGS